MKVSEPAAAYGLSTLNILKSRLKSTIDAVNDESKLQACFELLYADQMPGIYTDEEFAEELRLSETGGNATEEEINEMYSRWGVER